MKTTMPATPTAVNINHCTAYQKCGPSESSGSWIGLEAALLLRLHGQQADVARRNLDTAASAAMASELIKRI